MRLIVFPMAPTNTPSTNEIRWVNAETLGIKNMATIMIKNMMVFWLLHHLDRNPGARSPTMAKSILEKPIVGEFAKKNDREPMIYAATRSRHITILDFS